MNQLTVRLVTQPQEYFKDEISNAMSSLKIEVDDEVEFYLVNLLCEFMHLTNLNDAVGDVDVLDTPLALMLKRAVEAPPERQSKIYKRMGDTSLYVAGYFQDFFNRKAFDIDYYVSMGQTAYGALSHIMKDRYHDDHFAEIYEGLAQGFSDFVEVFAMVADTPFAASNDDNILALYDRWNSTRSDRLRKKLEKRGIMPVPVTKKAQ